MKPFVYEDIVDDAAKAQTHQLEISPEGQIVNRSITGRFAGRVSPITNIKDAADDPQIDLIKKAVFEPSDDNSAALEKHMNEARSKLKMPQIRWLKDAAPASA